VIARYAEHFMAGVAQPFEEFAGFPELLGSGALGEVAADHDQVRLFLVNPLLDRLDKPRVVGAKVQVGEVNEASHGE